MNFKGVNETEFLLNRFVQKAWCSYSEQIAENIWKEVSGRIPEPYKTKIAIEWGHVQMGHGRQQALSALKEEVDKFISEQLLK